MLLIQCVAVSKVLTELTEQEHPYKLAHALAMLSKRLQPHLEFYGQKERELVDEYGQKDEKGKVIISEDGRSFSFRDPAQGDEFIKRREELGKVEIALDGDPLSAPPPEKIRPDYLVLLEDFITFEE